jgi:hypothetical protein
MSGAVCLPVHLGIALKMCCLFEYVYIYVCLCVHGYCSVNVLSVYVNPERGGNRGGGETFGAIEKDL